MQTGGANGAGRNDTLCYSILMATLTIPKKFAAKDDLVVLPRKEYESLVRKAGAHAAKAKPGKKLPAWLRASLKDVEEGRVAGPFHTIKELRASLESDEA